MSQPPRQALKEWVTADFQLLEVGEVWDLKQLVDAVQGEYQRDNFFVLLRSEIQGSTAWVSYWNRSVITRGEKVSERVWLESAVLLLQEDRWRIQMLHSTRLTPEAVPSDLNWQPSSMR